MLDNIYGDRPKSIDYSAIPKLTYLGNYTRRLPISIARMMENALDWEHLPFIHRSSFAAIDGIEDGRWGWRAKGYLRAGNDAIEPNDFSAVDEANAQFLELLVDDEKNYWATTVVTGPGQGIEIHTQATSIAESEIEIDVRFYASGIELSDTEIKGIHEVLKDQYTLLYDEDTDLMQGRQAVLDRRKTEHAVIATESRHCVGDISMLRDNLPIVVPMGRQRFCVNTWKGEWVVYSADCTHLMGPLENETIDDDGTVTCPWHGYKFKVTSGEICEGKSRNLPSAPRISVENNTLYLVTG